MPSNEINFTLYHTDGCHLCDIAAELLQATTIQFQQVDICDDEYLAERYGTSIPVLKNTITGQELNWPFTLDQIIEFKGA